MKTVFTRAIPFSVSLFAAALTGCLDTSAPTGNELAVAAAGGTAPAITVQPRTQFAVRVGDRFAWSITATSATPMAYQWQTCDWNTVPNCANIANANGATYSRISHSADSTLRFRCVVSNASGSVKSNIVHYHPSPIWMQAEDAILSGSAVKGTAGDGWSGTGYVFFQSINGGAVEVRPSLSNAGTYTIWTRYNQTWPTSMKFEVNGVVVQPNLSFPAGGSDDDWNRVVRFNVQLKAGVNIIKATTLGWGGPKIDAIVVM